MSDFDIVEMNHGGLFMETYQQLDDIFQSKRRIHHLIEGGSSAKTKKHKTQSKVCQQFREISNGF